MVDLEHRAQGLAAGVRSSFAREQVPDTVLVERVRAEIGRAVSHPRAIEVVATGGVVRLSGDVLKDEVDGLLHCACKVRGVRDVEDRLTRHVTAVDVPSLQGMARRRRRPDTWSPAARIGMGGLGAAAALYGATSHRVTGPLWLGAGVTLFLRAAMDMPLARVFGVGAGRRAIDLVKSLHIDRPIEEVYAFFQNLENFPRFMSHLKSVRVTNHRSRWVLDGPAHLALSWDAEITEMEPNALLAWRSVEGSLIKSTGAVRFEREGPLRTRIEICMSYNPPAGALGHAVARLFGADAKTYMDDDLLRLKSLLETGRATAHHREISIGELTRGEVPQALGEPMMEM